ncbi:MAG: carbohydrate porin, partial [Rhizomicrobium sp.]|nr:carbohydrate porin [Rhizomicrobium sp.]
MFKILRRLAMTAGLALAVPTTSSAADLFTPHGLYNSALISDLSGGSKTGTVAVGAVHAQLFTDATPLGVPGLSLFLDGLGSYGGAPDALIGDAQGVSAIAAPPALRLYEGWLQYARDGVSILAGQYDLNSEFYRLASAGLFLNSAFGIGPEYAQSGVANPSLFPDPSLALRLAYKPADAVVLRLAVLNERALDHGGSDGALFIGELALLDRSDALPPGESRARVGRNAGLPAYENKLALGAWYDSKGNPDAFGPGNHHAAGAYAIGDVLLGTLGSGKLTGFAQLGISDGRVGRFGAYLGAGLTAVGLVAGRPNDELGLAVARAQNGAHFRSFQDSLPGLEPRDAETTL